MDQTTPSPEWAGALTRAFRTAAEDPLDGTGPVPVLSVARVLHPGAAALTDMLVARFLAGAPDNDAVLQAARLALITLDDAKTQELRPGSGDPGTAERRRWLYRELGLEACQKVLDDRVRLETAHTTVIATDYEPWYDQSARARCSTYWRHYAHTLLSKGWPAESVHALDTASTEVVARLSDPLRAEARQSKGLVVGYVQSGKTANFTGVIAKAVDAGYRLVVVLTGTIDLLRAQTQRRLDMELVGRENLLGGADRDHEDAWRNLEYHNDEAWIAGGFVSHGAELDQPGVPAIHRLTTSKADYERIEGDLTRLRYSRHDKSRPLNHPANLFHENVYLAVVKKNKAPLGKLKKDLEALGSTLDSLPVLIIDDESDQASVNTMNPRKKTDKDRTTINGLITDIMGLCKRAQYVGYTATPFANVFINPDDDNDLFPADFLISLQRPPGYMGVRDFHDLDGFEDRDQTVETSNERAYVRALKYDRQCEPEGWRSELLQAIDAFVLSAAIKHYRSADERRELKREYRHHTMLIHEATHKSAHAEAAAAARELWASGGFMSGTCATRLRKLFDEDFLPVMRARHGGEAVPETFEDLLPHVRSAIAKITHGVKDPVIVVNSDADVNDRSADFEKRDMWCILVGGTKLSRGFTVEGLTVSFFRRRSIAGDTMMQAGRWFGFRSHYRDLVRLYIRRDEEVDLYTAYEALMLDEESFRSELQQYEGTDDEGQPLLTPREVNVLVSQHLPWLRPTAANKMHHAYIVSKGMGGRIRDLHHLPERGSDDLHHDFEKVGRAMLSAALRGDLRTANYGLPRSSGSFDARVGLVDAPTMLAMLKDMRWHAESAMEPWIAFVEDATTDRRIQDWAVVWPQPVKNYQEIDLGEPVGQARVIRRARRADATGDGTTAKKRTDFVGSDEKHRAAVEPITRGEAALGLPPSTTRGVLLVYLVDDRPRGHGEGPPTERDLVVLPSIAVPAAASPHGRGIIRWTA